jgi:hypothetical protein
MSGKHTTVAGIDARTKVEMVLHVDMVVLEANTRAFEKLLDQFLKAQGFARIPRVPAATSRLLLALKSCKPFHFTPDGVFDGCTRHYEKGEMRGAEMARHYIHLWQVEKPEEFNLAQRMMACSDDTAYNEIDALIACEVQDYVRQVNWMRPPYTTTAVNEHTRFVRSVRRFLSRDLGTYLFKICGLLPALEQARWQQVGQFQSITGALNVVSEYWQSGHPGADGNLPNQLARSERRALLAISPPSNGGRRNAVAAAAAGSEDIWEGITAAEGRDVFECPTYFLNQIRLNRRKGN